MDGTSLENEREPAVPGVPNGVTPKPVETDATLEVERPTCVELVNENVPVAPRTGKKTVPEDKHSLLD